MASGRWREARWPGGWPSGVWVLEERGCRATVAERGDGRWGWMVSDGVALLGRDVAATRAQAAMAAEAAMEVDDGG